MNDAITSKLLIRFEGLSLAESYHAAEELRGMLKRAAGADVAIETVKEDEQTQDLVSTLVAIFGTSVALAIAEGIKDYIAIRGNRIVMETFDGRVIATGDGARNIDVAKTVEALHTRN